MKVMAGRPFTDDDRSDTVRVAIVNHAFVQRYLPDRNPLDVRFIWGYPAPAPKTMWQIIGVVEDVRYKSLAEAPEPAFYMPPTQSFLAPRQAVVIATRSPDPARIVPALRSQLKDLESELSVEYEPASAVVASTLSRQELGMTLLLIFGATAVSLAAL